MGDVILARALTYGLVEAEVPGRMVPVDSLGRHAVVFEVGEGGLAAGAHLVVDVVLEGAEGVGAVGGAGAVGGVGGSVYFGFVPRGGSGEFEERETQGGKVGGRGETITAKFGLLPGVPTRLSFPVGALDGQTLFLPRTPLRLKAVCNGRRTDPAEVGRVVVYLERSEEKLALRMSDLRVTAGPVEFPVTAEVLVDELGQWTRRTWPGKTTGPDELTRRLTAPRPAPASAPAPAPATRPSRFGGSPAHRFAATGRFRVEKHNEHWWMVDPDGRGFFSAGPDCMGLRGRAAVLPGTEGCFAWLPRLDDATFGDAVEGRPGTDGYGIHFPLANAIRAWGGDWKRAWTMTTVDLLRGHGFNTIANWSDLECARASGMPYVVPMPDFEDGGPRLFRSLEDVFAPGFEAACATWAGWLRQFEGDANLIGYFVTNEPDWAFGAFNLASEMLEAEPGTATRRELSRVLRAKYADDAGAWDRAWACEGKPFDAVVTETWRRAESRSDPARADLMAFSRAIVRRWMEVQAVACRAALPGVMNLGVRWAWISSDLCYEVAPWCDVFTINNYGIEPPLAQMSEIEQRSGRPVMIGEFHHGAVDRGLPSSGIVRVTDAVARGVAYRRYVELAAAHPACVGAHYFQYLDQPALGRFDGENYNIGLVDVCLRPHDELLAAARDTHARLYGLKDGTLTPVAATTPALAPIFF